MIEPKWLEQTFIVTNRADAPLSSVLDDISLAMTKVDSLSSGFVSAATELLEALKVRLK
jgi:hypothetical protein